MDLHHNLLEDKKTELIEQLKMHPFLQRCRDGEITMPELKNFLVQQGLYSSYFTRYLCALMSNLPSNEEVHHLAENLFEELGLEEGHKSEPHHLIYKNMLENFDLKLAEHKPTAGTHGLINAMLQHCKHHNPAYGLGAICLGAEALVPDLYSQIIEGFKSKDIVDKEIEFFRIHVECDDGHAETIRDIMVDLAKKDEQQIDIMLSSGQALLDARMRFFDDIVAT